MEKKRVYSGLFIIDPDKEESLDDVVGKIKNIINENSGDIVEDRVIGKKRLSYPISKKTEGVYYEGTFNALPSSIAKITRLCRINTDIMRSVINTK